LLPMRVNRRIDIKKYFRELFITFLYLFVFVFQIDNCFIPK